MSARARELLGCLPLTMIGDRDRTIIEKERILIEKEDSMSRLSCQLVEKEPSLQALAAPLDEKEHTTQLLSEQVNEKRRRIRLLLAQLAETTRSAAWRTVLHLSKIRVVLAPHSSLREQTWHFVRAS